MNEVVDTVRALIKKGLTEEEALAEVGSSKICPHCGHIGKDVVIRREYLGGQGYIDQAQCADRIACWARWDKVKEII